MKKSLVILLVFIGLSAGVAFSASSLSADDVTYTFCIHWKSQVVSYSDQDSCPKGNRKIIIHKNGVQGIQGIQGEQGLQGLPGIQGLQGVAGLKGETGTQGIQGVAGVSNSYSSTVIRSVYDSSGSLVGELYGASGRGITVKIGSSIVSYEAGEGNIQGGAEGLFLDNLCSGTTYSPADYANQYSVTFPFIRGINWFYDVDGHKVYDPFATYFVGKNVGAVMSVTSFYSSEYTGVAGAGGFECVHGTRTLRNALQIQQVEAFTPSFPRTISVPISIR